MKRILLSAAALISLSNVMAQGPVVIDTVITGAGYGTNVWYSLQNDEQETDISTNWDIALASSAAQNNPLTSSILFNSKVGKVYAIPNSNPATSFDSLATVNFAALTPLVNDDSDWAMGALRRASNSSQFDYGWGDYVSTTHSVIGSKVFVVVYNDNTKKKFYVNLITMQGKYEIISADLAAGAAQTTQNLVLSPYTSKNFAYYKINANTVIDREPATASWDFEFLQYDATIAPNMQYFSFGILNNVGIEAVKVTAVGDVPNFVNYQAQTFSDAANVIGYNWKNAQAQMVEDSTVYFVKTKDNNIWKMVFTKFTSGSSAGGNMNVFSKQNLTTLSVNELEKDVFVSVYPNPAANVATVVVDSKANTTVKVVSMTGQVVFETAASNGLTTTTIATENFTNGVYLVQVSNGAAMSTQRLVVQH